MSVARRIGELGIEKISWSGGEPLEREDLEEIMLEGRRYGIRGYDLVTNGYLLTKDRLERIIAAGLTGIQISIDGVDQQQNLIIRKGPKDSFSRAVNAIKMCVDKAMPIALGTMLYPEMVPTLDEMYDLAARLDVNMLRFSGFVPNGRGDQKKIRQRMKLSPAEITEFLRFLRRRYWERPGFIGLDYSFALNPFLGSFYSPEGLSHFFIDYQGDVFPSTGSEREIFKVGNVIEEDLHDILGRSHLVPARPSRNEIVGICKNCDKFDECGGGPREVSYMFSGELNTSPELCLYHEYQERAGFLGESLWLRTLSSFTIDELTEVRDFIGEILSSGRRQGASHAEDALVR